MTRFCLHYLFNKSSLYLVFGTNSAQCILCSDISIKMCHMYKDMQADNELTGFS